MAQASADVESGSGVGYCRRRPEDTLLYQVVEHYYPLFTALRAEQGRALPAFVQREFEEYLKCDRLEHGSLNLRREHHCQHRVCSDIELAVGNIFVAHIDSVGAVVAGNVAVYGIG